MGLIMSILGFVPGLLSLATTYFANRTNAQIAIFQAKTGAARDVAVAAINEKATVETKWWFAALPEAVIGMAIATFVVKAVVWDKVVASFVGCSGRQPAGVCVTFATDPLTGDLSWVFLTVVGGYFGNLMVSKFLSAK